MSKKAEAPAEPPVEERRASDADGAIEVAFVEGVLPEEDRRAPEPEPEVPVGIPVAEEPVPSRESAPPKSLEDVVEVGSIIERTPRGWQARLMYGGAHRLHGEGPTVEEAVRDAFGAPQ